ncbi:MAG: LysR family transcriptional regulator, partial [Myxococcales bacterium]|nr:LysR family transcriptional regulator [Myxococcales bacterium]
MLRTWVPVTLRGGGPHADASSAPLSAPRAHVRVTVYLGDHKIGPGKIELLEAIDEGGSISAAARAMGMAYRHAWEMVDDLNRCFRRPVTI